MKELMIVVLSALSWTAAMFFSDGIETIVDGITEKYHNKAIVYLIFSIIFIFIAAFVSKKYGVN